MYAYLGVPEWPRDSIGGNKKPLERTEYCVSPTAQGMATT